MTTTPPLDDRDRENLSAYLDGELDQRTARALEARLDTDATARREADTLRRTWDLLDYLPRPEPSPDFTHRTLERLTVPAAARPGPSPRARLRRWLTWGAWAAALLLAAAAGYGITNARLHRTAPSPDEQLGQDLGVIVYGRLYEQVDDIDFLHKLANPNDPDLFGDDNLGS